jgi:hypothetical protein
MYRVSKRPDKGSGFFVVLEAKSVDILHAMKHIVLLGDSIFDNAVYVNGGPDVIKQLRSILPQDWQASLLAVDGSVTTDVITQIPLIPASATHLTVSAGGNDGLSRADILERPVGSVGAAVDQLAALRAEFQIGKERPGLGATLEDGGDFIAKADQSGLDSGAGLTRRRLSQTAEP